MVYLVLNLNTIQELLEKLGLQYERPPGLNMLVVTRPQNPNRALRIVAAPDESIISMAIVGEFKVPPHRIVEVSCAVAIANSLMDMGSWCLNYAESEVYFRLAVPSQQNSWTEDGIQHLMEMTLGYASLFFPRLQAVALEGASFETVLSVHSRN